MRIESWIILVAVGCGGTADSGSDTDCRVEAEIAYDGIDQDCDGFDLTDADGDGFDAIEAGGSDCDDTVAAIHPDAEDTVGDDVDDNCDEVDGVDSDGDGVASEASGGEDCDDTNAQIAPGLTDEPYDGIDQDCADGDRVDVDGDGFDSDGVGGADCDDDEVTVYPGAADSVGDGVDQNCDSIDGVDGDGDGYAARASGGDDCDDADSSVSPGETEIWYDGIDSDCDRACDFDQDGDGWLQEGAVVVDGDLCDASPAVGEVAYSEDCNDFDLAAWIPWVGSCPADGGFVSGESEIVVTLGQDDPLAVLDVVDSGGAQVAGNVTSVGGVVTFVPMASLVDGEYTATLSYGCGIEAFSFEATSTPGVVTNCLVGAGWSLDFSTSTIGGGIGAVLAPDLVDFRLLLEMVDGGANTVDVIRAIGSTNPIAQDLCIETVTFVDAVEYGTPVVLGPTDFAFFEPLAQIPITWMDWTLSFDMNDDSTLENVLLTGLIDTRPIVPFVGGTSPGDVCDLLLAFGQTCETCPDGSGDFCFWVEAPDPGVEPLPVSLVERTGAAIAADPSCP